MSQTLTVARKEIRGYFGSPMALMFIGAFLAITLFSFFWVDTFFARGIADVRPLFRWMPVLLMFLIAALTMRQWSEEQRSGTLEILMTLPVGKANLVLGKFIAVMALVALSLALTAFLPVTVALLGDLDWGPVAGGYLAALLLASAYAAIGLFVSSRTDNQIVSLILTVLVCGVFYLVGSGGVTAFFGDAVAEVLRALGSGSRFESVQRGVIDLRDLAYYLSLTIVFLTLNVVSLEAKGWGDGSASRTRRRSMVLSAALIVLNLVLLNAWLYPMRRLRVDLTQDREYTLSQTTKDLIGNLQEPLLIRAYVSEKTHPLLAPLVPRIRDMLSEYAIASGGNVTAEVIDPATDPDIEAEANQTYGIRPVPFQVAGRYETSIINSYFDILVRYGDQNVVLNFEDLIEVEPRRDGTVDVRLRNLEYDLTSSVKKAVQGFQSVDAVLDSLPEPAELTLYATSGSLPEWLVKAPATIESVVGDIAGDTGKLSYRVVDPDAPGSSITVQELYDKYGLQPVRTSPFSPESYYLHMVLETGDQAQVIYPSGSVAEADVRTAIESALKRSSTGFLKVVGLWTPPATPRQDMFGRPQEPISSWTQLQESLEQEYEVRALDLKDGTVPTDVDVLLVVAPQDMDDVQRYAIDQFLMRGGAVIVAAGNYALDADPTGRGLALRPVEDGLRDILADYGIDVVKSLVMDTQNEPFPVPVVRNVGNYQVQEIQAISFPFFVDIRSDGMNAESPVVAGLPAVTMNWSSPIVLDQAKNKSRETVALLASSPTSWTQTDTNIQPDFDTYPGVGFPSSRATHPYTLAVSAHGVFQSAFKDAPLPVPPGEGEAADAREKLPMIDVSPKSARLIVISSGEFVDDIVFRISSQLTRDRYLNSLRLVHNAVAWATEDLDMLNIGARGTHTRVLAPLPENTQSFWEGLNYVAALAALVIVGIVWSARRRGAQPMELMPPEELGDDEEEAS